MMNLMRILLGSGIGAAFTGTTLAVVFYLSEKKSSSSTILGPASDWAWLGLIFGALCGVFVGAISGAIIVNFGISTVKAMLFGFMFNLFIGSIFFLYSGGGWNDSLLIDFVAFIIVGVINALIVSLINLNSVNN